MAVVRARHPVAAVVVAILLGWVLFWISTSGMQALERTDPSPAASAAGRLPEFLYNVPDTARTTADYGPVGPVAAVFAVPEVREGLLQRMPRPWVAVSSVNGDYRALSAPERPGPRAGAVSVAPDGQMLAWGFEDGLVLYDPLTDRAREVRDAFEGVPTVGRFSPDGSLLLVYDGELRIVGVAAGEVVGTAVGMDARIARQAVWTRGGDALTYVDQGDLVTHTWADGTERRTPTRIQPRSTLAWSPDGERLAALRTVRGVRTVEVYDVGADGSPRLASVVERDGYAIQGLLGFGSGGDVAVTALALDTATLPRAFEMSTTADDPPADLMQLPTDPVSLRTLNVAAEPLRQGSAPFPEPNWPISELAKLVAGVVAVAFFLGLYVTRRPR